MSMVAAGTPVFQSVGQALHVSYLMEVLPATQRSVMQVLMETKMKENGVYDEPRAATHTLNFGGMSALEVRGQCAMVRGMVDHHLMSCEAAAVKAQFGHQVTLRDGVRALVDYAAPAIDTVSRAHLNALAWGLFAPKGFRAGLSVRSIAEEMGGSKDACHQAQQRLLKLARDLLGRGMGNLDGHFKQGGLVDAD